jgi:hypothetical protein
MDHRDEAIQNRDEYIAKLRAALERITRECDALNKGPVAVAIAREALSQERPTNERATDSATGSRQDRRAARA